MTLTLRDVDIDRSDPRVLRWTLELCYPHRDPLVVVVRTLRNGLVLPGIQQLGPAQVESDMPADAVGVIAARLKEELVRAKLVAALGRSSERRAA
jgi:hypothetical protein